MEELTFEQALVQLEQTVEQLEAGSLSLEASLALYEQGQKLASFCSSQLETAQLKVEMISADGSVQSTSL